MKKLLLILLTLITFNSFSTPATYTVTKGVTTNVTCNVGDTLKFYGTAPTGYGVSINSSTVIAIHPCMTTPYYIGYYVIIGSENTFSINASVIWTGTITVNGTTGLEENNESANIKLFPNPTTNVFTIANISSANVNIYNTIGKLIKQQNFTNETLSMNLADLPKGIYMVEVLMDGKRSVTKLVKE